MKEWFKKTWAKIANAYKTKGWLKWVTIGVAGVVVATAVAVPIALNAGKDDDSATTSTNSEQESVVDSSVEDVSSVDEIVSSETQDSEESVEEPVSSDAVSEEEASSEEEHEHVYASVTVEATCENKGEIVYTCDCGDSYSEEIDALGHDYNGATCSRCGEANPDWVEEEKTPSVGLEYALSDDGTYYILMGMGTCTDTDVVIPAEYEGLPVKEIYGEHLGNEIYSSAFYQSDVTSVYVPDSVEMVGTAAFGECLSLTSVRLSKNLKRVSDNMFIACWSLPSITIPNSVKSIGEYAFAACSVLTEVIIPNSVETIECAAFFLCSELTSVVIPDSVKTIEETAFMGCANLESVVIGSSVTYIGEMVFGGISAMGGVEKLTNITFKGTVEQWNAIEKEFGWHGLAPAEKVVCNDGEVAIE